MPYIYTFKYCSIRTHLSQEDTVCKFQIWMEIHHTFCIMLIDMMLSCVVFMATRGSPTPRQSATA